jgi:GGDEF domain-containing protein/predicted transcriptional regulator
VGVQYGQGFFIQRPAPALPPIKTEIKELVHDLNKKKNHLFGDRLSDIYIANIASSLLTLSPQILISQVYAMMKADANIPGFCITENGFVTGVITRDQLNAGLSSQYGYSLYYKKPVRELMSRDFMCVDMETPIDLVAKTAMQRTVDRLYDFITVTKGERYFGIVTVRDLLMKTIEIEIVNAKHLNPLTELPGNLMIEKHLEKCLKLQRPQHILYIDIDNFKPYNDVYGFEKGDMVLRTVTAILKQNIPSDQFIGHIGGDDFIAVLQSGRTEEICNSILKQFDDSVINHYSQEDVANGFILSKNRHGVEESFPLMSISIAGLSNRNLENIFELSEKASLIKKNASNAREAFIWWNRDRCRIDPGRLLGKRRFKSGPGGKAFLGARSACCARWGNMIEYRGGAYVQCKKRFGFGRGGSGFSDGRLRGNGNRKCAGCSRRGKCGPGG